MVILSLPKYLLSNLGASGHISGDLVVLAAFTLPVALSGDIF